MESQRSFILIGLALVSFLLWQEWQDTYGPQPVTPVEQNVSIADAVPSNAVPSVTAPVTTNSSTSDVPEATPTAQQVIPEAQAQAGRVIDVITDTLSLQIDLVGGDVIKADLLKYPVTQDSDEPYSLLRPTFNGHYIAQSGLVGANGPDANPAGRPLYTSANSKYVLDGNTLEVLLTWMGADGLAVEKRFLFERGSHAIAMQKTIINNTDGSVVVQPYAQLKQTFNLPDGSTLMPTYRGAAYGTEKEQYSKYSFGDIEDERLQEVTPAGWIAMIEHYFLSAWVPPQDKTNTIYTNAIGTDYAAIGYTSEPISILPGQQASVDNILYLGPKDQDTLKTFAKGLQLTVDYGILWFISEWLFWLLQIIHGVVGNWGVAIIVITLIVKGVMYPLTKKQYESMAKMRELTPKMQQIKERAGDDRQKMSQAMMELYKKEKVNPMGGCWPLLLQMPIFLALYWVFLESVELRQAEFVFWITDLSIRDPFFVLPILTGLSMWALQKLQPMTMTDEMQKKIMQFMPIMMTVFFMFFPAGLVLYWLVSNLVTLVQAKMIYAAMEKKGLKAS